MITTDRAYIGVTQIDGKKLVIATKSIDYVVERTPERGDKLSAKSRITVNGGNNSLDVRQDIFTIFKKMGLEWDTEGDDE